MEGTRRSQPALLQRGRILYLQICTSNRKAPPQSIQLINQVSQEEAESHYLLLLLLPLHCSAPETSRTRTKVGPPNEWTTAAAPVIEKENGKLSGE